jgi:hypothetical protein
MSFEKKVAAYDDRQLIKFLRLGNFGETSIYYVHEALARILERLIEDEEGYI